jgi:hypothetical protein
MLGWSEFPLTGCTQQPANKWAPWDCADGRQGYTQSTDPTLYKGVHQVRCIRCDGCAGQQLQQLQLTTQTLQTSSKHLQTGCEHPAPSLSSCSP